jgi:hypothetical protein
MMREELLDRPLVVLYAMALLQVSVFALSNFGLF